MPTLLSRPLAACSLVVSLSAPCAFAQQSAAVLHAPLVALPVDSAPFQRLADFDGDGDLDAVGSRIHENRSNTEIVVWRNDQGAFTPVWQSAFLPGGISAPAPRSFAIETADFDGDLRADFVVAGGFGVMRCTAQPNFAFQIDTYALPLWSNQHAVATGDFDGDGVPDFAVAFLVTGATGELRVYPTGGAMTSMPITASYEAPLRLAALELDGQPGREVLLSDRNSNTARIYGIAAGQLVLQQTLTTALNYVGGTPWLWTGGDIDGDADVDVVVFKPELGTGGVPRYQVFRRTGPTTLVAEAPAIGGPAEYLADIDGDGDLDGVCCGGGGPIYQWPKLDFASTFEISPNDGNGAFARAWDFPGAGSESMAGAADVDGDGDVDFVAGRCIFYGAGPWTTHPVPKAGGTNATIVGRPWLVRDIDRDGDPDFFTQRNDGSGDMTAAVTNVPPPAGSTFGAYLEADVDGDGAKDIVQRLIAINPPLPAQFQYMVLLQNNGGGHFTYAGQVGPTGMQIGSQYAYTIDNYLGADLDGDGDDDIVANEQLSDGANGSCQIFWNVGGWFTPGPIYDLFAGGRVDAVADFDGDDLPDLVMSGNLQGLHVRRGTGNPAQPFVTTWSAPPMPFEPAAVAIGDVNDDGRVDFVRPNANGEPVLFVNQTPPGGAPTFAASTLGGVRVVLSPSGGAAVRSTIAIGDFDGDGRSDLALGRIPLEPNIGIVLRRIGSSSPLTLADYAVVRHAFLDGFAADADGDGDVDLIGSRTTQSRRFVGASAGRRLQVHDGTAGEGGAVPVLGATGPFRVGETEVLRLTGVPGPTIAVLGISLGAAALPNVPLPGLTLWLDPAALIVGDWPISAPGFGRAAAMTTLPIWLPNGLQGFSFWAQAFVFDPAAPAWFSSSNALQKTVGW